MLGLTSLLADFLAFLVEACRRLGALHLRSLKHAKELDRVLVVGALVQQRHAVAVVLNRGAEDRVAVLLVEEPLVNWFPGKACCSHRPLL